MTEKIYNDAKNFQEQITATEIQISFIQKYYDELKGNPKFHEDEKLIMLFNIASENTSYKLAVLNSRFKEL